MRIAAISVFSLVVLVHILTFLPIPLSMDHVFYFHIFAIASIAFVVVDFGQTKQPGFPETQKEFLKIYKQMVPLPIKLGMGILFIYSIMNFVMNLSMIDGGTPEVYEDGFALFYRGEFTREITEKEYILFRRLLVRAFSGYWMVFTSAPVIYLTLKKKILDTLEE